MSKYANSKRLDVHYEVGDWVWAKFHHYKQKSVAKRLNFKISKRYFGPFQISAQIGPVAYKLELPHGCTIHLVLHVSLLKAYKGPVPPPTIVYDEADQAVIPQPQALVAERVIHMDDGDQYQVLVEWQGMPREDATWESWNALVELYTGRNLEDKVLFQGGSNDTTQKLRSASTRVKGAPSWAKDFIS